MRIYDNGVYRDATEAEAAELSVTQGPADELTGTKTRIRAAVEAATTVRGLREAILLMMEEIE